MAQSNGAKGLVVRDRDAAGSQAKAVARNAARRLPIRTYLTV